MPTPLLAPRNGAYTFIDTDNGWRDCVDHVLDGAGPIAIDAERASGFRYSQRAYLIQIFRRGTGIYLIDPIALTGSDHTERLNHHLRDEEWVIHASTQDLPCLHEFGIAPKKLFDTELGARLAGFARVGLGPLTETLLDLTLAKEHSAVDWSKRPLHSDWLNYAALDVDVLLDIRDGVAAALEEQNKLAWAEADFHSIITTFTARAQSLTSLQSKKREPWRRTSGMHKVRSRRSAGCVKALWEKRDAIAREIDIAPGRLLNDSLLVELALRAPKTLDELMVQPEFKRIRNPLQRSYFQTWITVLIACHELSEDELPPLRTSSDAMPPTKIWREKFPLAYARYTHARALLSECALAHNLPAENLVTPDFYKQLCWLSLEKPEFIGNVDRVARALMDLGARQWQINLVAPCIAQALTESEPIELSPASDEKIEPADGGNP